MMVTTAIIQMTGVPGEAVGNRARTCELAEKAMIQGARLVVLPELIISGYMLDRDALAKAAEPVDGPTFKAWLELARKYNAYIAGGICDREGDDLYNAAIL